MIYCVDIRDYVSGNTIETIFETENFDEAYEVARKWNEENDVTNEDIDSFYNEDILMHEDGHICKRFADVYQDEIRRFKEVVNMDNTYGCDICGNRKDWDYGIVWITSSYGVCYECYKKLSREDVEYLRKKYE